MTISGATLTGPVTCFPGGGVTSTTFGYTATPGHLMLFIEAAGRVDSYTLQ